MVSVVWGTHALPVYWELLGQVGSSDLTTQQRLLKTALSLFKSYPVLVLGDREFHSPKLAAWLDKRGVFFALRQKKRFISKPILATSTVCSEIWASSQDSLGFIRAFCAIKAMALAPLT